MRCHYQGNIMIDYVKSLKRHLIKPFYLLFILHLSDCISIHPMGKYTLHDGISHISTVQPQYVPWKNPPLPPIHRSLVDGRSIKENAGSFSDIFGENRRRAEIQVTKVSSAIPLHFPNAQK